MRTARACGPGLGGAVMAHNLRVGSLVSGSQARGGVMQADERRPLGDAPPGGGVWVADANDTIVYASEGLAAMAGVPAEQIVGHSVRDGFSEETLAEFRPHYVAAAATKEPVYYDRIRVATPGGRVTYQSGWLVPRLTADGAFDGMICTVSDVTQTHAAEGELVASRERWRTLVKLAPVGVFRTDAAGDCVFVNAKWSVITGLPAEQATGRGWAAALHPDDRERVENAWYESATTGCPFDHEYRFVHPDGDVVWVRGISERLVDASGETRGYLGVLVEMTETRRAIEELERERHRAERYLDASDLILIALNEDGTVIRANDRARDLLETPHAPLVGSDWFERCVPDMGRDEVRAVLQELIGAEPGPSEMHENEIVLPDGSRRLVQWHNTVLRQEEGSVVEVLALGIDVTELRTAEALRQESEAKDRFLANMSHELRTPLNSIIGFSSVLLSGLADDLTEEQHKQVSIINQAGRYLLELVNDLLDVEQVVSGRAALRFEDVSWSELIGSVVAQVGPDVSESGLSLTFSGCADCPVVRTDSRRVTQIVLNLIGNAVKFTREGSIDVRAVCDTSSVRVTVADTGIGISKAELERVFELYHQAPRSDLAKSRGAGIGLSLSRSYARLLGGDLTVESTPGEGSSFTLTLPLVAPVHE